MKSIQVTPSNVQKHLSNSHRLLVKVCLKQNKIAQIITVDISGLSYICFQTQTIVQIEMDQWKGPANFVVIAGSLNLLDCRAETCLFEYSY